MTFLIRRAVVLALAVPALALAQGKPKATAINIPFEHYTLPNGLNVVLAPDHSSPTAEVNVYYHVGSKNEIPGHTGFAHLFEHTMFVGSGHVPYGTHDRLTEGVGGGNNAFTSEDETVYFENIPSNYLESSLWLESDRMGFLLDNLDSAKFAAQRDVVQNERRQSYENRPYGRSGEIVTAAMYPATNPYSWPVVGYMADLRLASMQDVKNFFRSYYAPSNATLTIVGDFSAAQAKEWVARYFRDLPSGPKISRPSIVPGALTREKRLVFEDRVQVPRLYMAWPTVGLVSNDTYALNVLADILAPSRTARLSKALVYDRQSAAEVNAGQNDHEGLGEFGITVTPRPGHTLAELEATTDSIVERLKAEGPTAEEMRRALAGLEFGFVNRLQSNFQKALTLGQGVAIYGDPGHYKIDYANTKAVTAADVKRVANKYLGPGRIVLSVVPIGKTELASKPEASTKVITSADGGHYTMEHK